MKKYLLLALLIAPQSIADISFNLTPVEGDRTAQIDLEWKMNTKRINLSSLSNSAALSEKIEIDKAIQDIKIQITARVGGTIKGSNCTYTKTIKNGYKYTINLRGASIYKGEFNACTIDLKSLKI